MAGRFETVPEGEFLTYRDREGGLCVTVPDVSVHEEGSNADASHPSYDAMFRHPKQPLAVRVRLDEAFGERLAERGEGAAMDIGSRLLSYARHRAKAPLDVYVESFYDDQLYAMGADAGAYAAYDLKQPENDFQREMTICLFRAPDTCYTVNILSGLETDDPELLGYTELILGNLAFFE